MTQIATLLLEKKYSEIKQDINNLNSADIALLFEELEEKTQISVLFKLLSKDVAAEVFSYLSHDRQQMLIECFSDKEIASIVKDLYVDDAVSFLEEMPANVVERVLKNTTAEARANINTILMYPDNSAGSLMTVEFVDLKSEQTIEQAFARIRKIGKDKETINTCYVTDSKHILQGVVTVKDLLLSIPHSKIRDIMNTNTIFVYTYDNQEDVSKLFSKYDLTALPVVDKENRLVGIITVDDIIDVIEQENTKDFHQMAAINPMEDSYLQTSVFTHARKRIVWLLFLMVSAIVTGTILSHYEESYILVPALVSFIPMIMGTGGNSGSQASTLIIRGLALGEINFKDYFKVFYKEVRVALIVGFVLSVFNFVRIILINNSFTLAITVSITLYFTVVFAKLIGFSLPLLAKKLKLDPALMASPLISTISDIISMLIYFTVASIVFGL